ncbi:MAG: hypothetical protein WAV93_00655 [Bacteroidales bacterium]
MEEGVLRLSIDELNRPKVREIFKYQNLPALKIVFNSLDLSDAPPLMGMITQKPLVPLKSAIYLQQ